MSTTWAKGLSHREFLKVCGLALAGAGASQMVVPPKPALAADGNFDNLTVTGNAYLCTTSGNVGIGTSNPGARLQLLDTANNNNPLIHVLNENNWKEMYCETVSNGADDDITRGLGKPGERSPPKPLLPTMTASAPLPGIATAAGPTIPMPAFSPMWMGRQAALRPLDVWSLTRPRMARPPPRPGWSSRTMAKSASARRARATNWK